MSEDVLITNIGELITLEPLAKEKRFIDIKEKDLGRLKNAWLYIEKGKVKDFGQGEVAKAYLNQNPKRIDAASGLVMPGLVDCHTHPVYGGNRAQEFARRLAGATYKEIAAEGGGIAYTVAQTRDSDDSQLLEKCLSSLKSFLKHGVTTVEVKSGYGLTVKDELRLLRVLKEAQNHTPQTLSTTLLALHAIPKEAPSKQAFIKDMTENLLPIVAREKLADWVDAFIEEGYFSREDALEHLKAAKKLGLSVRLHADEFTNQKGGVYAASLGAASADHLEYTDEESIAAMAKASVVAVLLPGTSLYTKIPYTKAAPFLQGGCPIALATDYNPGSCQVKNLAFTATIGALHCGLDLPHAVAAVTYVAARALRLENKKGALAPSFDGDVLIYKLSSIEEWLSGLGQKDPHTILINGQPS